MRWEIVNLSRRRRRRDSYTAKEIISKKTSYIKADLGNLRFVESNHVVITQMNAALVKKCDAQKIKDAEAEAEAAKLYAGV